MLSIPDMKDDAKVLAHLDDTLFIDSSVTLSAEEYLKDNIKEKLLYEGCMSNHLFVVNEDVDALEQAQTTYIFNRDPEDVRILLNLALVNSPIKIEQVEKTEERLKKEAEQHGDLESLIELTKKAEGSYRVKYITNEDEIRAAIGAGVQPPAKEQAFLIELPVVIDPDSLDWSQLSEKDVMNFLENCLVYASGATQTLWIRPEMFPQEVQDFAIDLPRLADLGFAHARNSAMNSVAFQSVKDPFKALFDGVIAPNVSGI